jgi:hypothetical protein
LFGTLANRDRRNSATEINPSNPASRRCFFDENPFAPASDEKIGPLWIMLRRSLGSGASKSTASFTLPFQMPNLRGAFVALRDEEQLLPLACVCLLVMFVHRFAGIVACTVSQFKREYAMI